MVNKKVNKKINDHKPEANKDILDFIKDLKPSDYKKKKLIGIKISEALYRLLQDRAEKYLSGKDKKNKTNNVNLYVKKIIQYDVMDPLLSNYYKSFKEGKITDDNINQIATGMYFLLGKDFAEEVIKYLKRKTKEEEERIKRMEEIKKDRINPRKSVIESLEKIQNQLKE
jgi:hypothetical protein